MDNRARLHKAFAKVMDMDAAEEITLRAVNQAIEMLSSAPFINVPAIHIGIDPIVTVTWIKSFDGVSLYFNGNEDFGYGTKYGNDHFRYKERNIKQKLLPETTKQILELSKESHHPSYVVGWNGNFMELVESIGNMSFSRQADLFGLMSKEMIRQAEAGHTRQRLASRLHAIAAIFDDLKGNYAMAAKISNPSMEETAA